MIPCLDSARTEDLRSWLLHAPIQISTGHHQGGIAGWLDENDVPAFLYGEITGYYLTCGGFMAERGEGERLRYRAAAAAEWLRGEWQTPPPPTRHYLAGAAPDWRNDAVFSFDCAMMLRGLTVFDGGDARANRAAVAAQLARHVGPDGVLTTHVMRTSAAAELPARWSTRPGPFQVKTAASILLSHDVPDALRAAAEATVLRWRNWYTAHEPEGDVHPLLYHLEGLLMYGVQSGDEALWRTVAEVYADIMLRQNADGGLPATLADGETATRSDVAAQALRIGCLLVEAGYLNGARWEQRLRQLAANVLSYVDSSGGVHFQRRNGHAPHVNVWCTVFAYQALALFEELGRGFTIDADTMRSIA